MRGWRRHMRCGKTTAATTMGSRGKPASTATPTTKMMLRARAARNAGGSNKNKDRRNRTHGFNLHVALSLNA